ncbi:MULTISPECIES: hypothetical protein [unclassified Mycobacterium]|uniref:hypothetical protein n=1 Tax=unclassified Mycobacterium TaxID=2642494 RepID=UPI0007FFACF9|nr:MULTISPECIES: hypothetical protein [unclassified Mycobacterium]OBG58889.1 hypothetical protein A5703_03025 [Mycobacterium sp. E188]OBH37266.1 hypothetical protein A5691_26925 [Mycobacterium sp. E183]
MTAHEELCTLCDAKGRSVPAVLIAAFAYCEQHLREAQDRAIADAIEVAEQFGSPGQAVMSDHVWARRLRETGDPLDEVAADGYDMTAQTRTDAEIAGWPRDAVTDDPATATVADPADVGLSPWSAVSMPGDSAGP